MPAFFRDLNHLKSIQPKVSSNICIVYVLAILTFLIFILRLSVSCCGSLTAAEMR
jgi:hypothetical protein